MSGSGETEREAVLSEIREEYARRTDRWNALNPTERRVFDLLMDRRHRAYERMLRRGGLLPLADRKILDVGAGRNEWLVECRNRWGQTADELCGIELLPERVEQGLAAYPFLQLVAGSADHLPWPDNTFDLVHQGMLLSSIPDEALRQRVVAEMRRVTSPGGYVLWYDFVWNPVNRATVGISRQQVREYFAGWKIIDCERATLAPPLARRLVRIWEPLADLAESMRALNFWELALFQKPSAV